MKNEASKTRSLDIAFVVTPDLLKRLAVILGETSDTLEYTAKFSDGTSVHYNKIEDVIGQPNSDERSIVSLIAGTADETVKSAYVNPKKNDSPSLEYTINGAQRDVIYFADQLDDWVAATRQWYSPFFSSKIWILWRRACSSFCCNLFAHLCMGPHIKIAFLRCV